MFFVGIDPGSSGAIALIGDSGEPLECWDMPYKNKELDCWELANIFNNIKETSSDSYCFCVLEKCQYTPAIKGSGAFTFGKTIGITETVLAFSGIPHVLVLPQKWKKEFSLIKKDKQASIILAKRMFPSFAKKFLKTKDGRAEAFLLSEYCRRLYGRTGF